MTPTQSAELVALLATSFPAAKFSEDNAEVYERMILDLDFDLAQRGVAALMATSKFLPTIAEIRAAARDAGTTGRRAPAEAWGDVVEAIRAVGSYRSPTFTDPIVTHAVKCLGWRNVCLDDSSEASLRARFCEIYAAASERTRNGELVEPLVRSLPSGTLSKLLAGIGGKP